MCLLGLTVQFVSKINQKFQSTAQLLAKLHTCTGLVYLKDNHHPVIAFQPTYYQVYQNHQIQCFQHDAVQDYVQVEAEAFAQHFQFTKSDVTSSDAGFTGGFIGFVSYDYAAQSCTNGKMRSQPALYLGQYDSFLKKTGDDWYFYSHANDAQQQWQQLQILLGQSTSIRPLVITQPVQNRWSKTQYRQAFEQIQQYILAGDCYQINLTQEFTAPCQGQLLSRADECWTLTNAPFSGYLNIHGFELLSCSPELFIEFDAQHKIKTRPIKGTMPRFANTEQDEQSKQKLKSSEKDQAENLMIVDLLRNDLSVHAETGSVKTTKLFEIESFSQVHHMVSEIEATLTQDTNPLVMLMSALPGGSITGAPKIRAMQIIDELEQQPRGAYCGSLGYFNFDGSGRWNVLIRSIQHHQNELSIWAGGGITVASKCEDEYQECFDKVSAMLNLLDTWQTTLETETQT